jgi:hypothetical protein
LIYGCTHPGSIKPDEFTGKPDYRDKSFASELKDFIPVYAKITRDNISIDQSFFLSHFYLRYLDDVLAGPGLCVFSCISAGRSDDAHALSSQSRSIRQVNVVWHTFADAQTRILGQPIFMGKIGSFRPFCGSRSRLCSPAEGGVTHAASLWRSRARTQAEGFLGKHSGPQQAQGRHSKALLQPEFSKLPGLVQSRESRARIISRVMEIAEKNRDTISTPMIELEYKMLVILL